MFNGFHGVLYRELTIYSKRFKKQILSSSISPLLFLIAFGWGFGKGVSVEGVPYMVFLVPGLITMASLNQSYSIAQEINISRFYFHVFDEYLVSPITHTEIILGEAAYGIIKGLISTVLIILYAWLFHVTLSLSGLFVLAVLMHTFLFSCLGITVSMIVRDHGDQAMVNNFVITPMIFLCGTFFPVDNLPSVFKWIVQILPLTYSIKVIRSTMIQGFMPWDLFFVLAAFGAVFFATARMALSKVEA
ncbi:MAG TPA: ABC transporter permease [Thermodesulfovibrionia bacterium]|nr:ABC transporter permease [Thermodesulfovibrionia bacterium]